MYWVLLWTGFLSFLGPPTLLAGEEDKLHDLTGGVVLIISSNQANSFMAGGELFSSGGLTTRSEIQYTVRVKNQTGDPIIASSLRIVVDKIMELARSRNVTREIEIFGHDGYTEEGKPFFKIPTGASEDLAPYAESGPVVVRIRNPDLLRLAPPSFKIYGNRRSASQKIDDLREVLIQKGILSPEEATEILGSQSSPSTP